MRLGVFFKNPQKQLDAKVLMQQGFQSKII